MTDASSRAALVILAVLATCAGLYWASVVLEPLAFALFIIALLWPLQNVLQSFLPKLVALLITLGVLIAGLLVLGTLIGWSVSRAGQALASDAARLQSLYEQLLISLEGHGIAVAALWAEHINIGWYIRLVQSLISRLNSTLSFWLVVLVYVALGLLEVDDFAARIRRIGNGEMARTLLDGTRVTATKFRAYFLMRTKMSRINKKIANLDSSIYSARSSQREMASFPKMDRLPRIHQNQAVGRLDQEFHFLVIPGGSALILREGGIGVE